MDQFYNMSKHKDGKDAYCKRCRQAVTREYARKLTPEQRERRVVQTQEFNLRKFGTTYEPQWSRRARAKARLEAEQTNW